MQTIKTILFLFSLFIFPVIGNNCSCAAFIETFCQNLPPIDGTFNFHVVSAKVTEPQHGGFEQYMQVEVLENIYNSIEAQSITIIGQDGANCAEQLHYFEQDGEFIFYLFPHPYNSPNPDSFYLDGCGRSWLRLEDNIVNGPIRPEVMSQDYQSFKDSLLTCSNLSTSVEDIKTLTEKIHIFPNPVHTLFNIESEDYLIENLAIYAITGRKILEKQGGFHKNMSLDLTGYAPGLYFVNVQINGQVITKKVVKN